MSHAHPIISITGSSGAGTTSVKRIFELIFRREKIEAAFIEGDAFHRYDRAAMKREGRRGGGPRQPALQPLQRRGEPARRRSRRSSRSTAETGTGRTRTLRPRREEEAELYGRRPAPSPPGATSSRSDLLFYEGLHGCAVTDTVNLARHADLKIGVVPVDQPRMDPEDPPRPRHPRLLDRGGHRHDPAPDARLRALHLPAVLRRRTSTSSACRSSTPRTRSSPAGSRRPTSRCGHPLRATRAASTSPTCSR